MALKSVSYGYHDHPGRAPVGSIQPPLTVWCACDGRRLSHFQATVPRSDIFRTRSTRSILTSTNSSLVNPSHTSSIADWLERAGAEKNRPPQGPIASFVRVDLTLIPLAPVEGGHIRTYMSHRPRRTGPRHRLDEACCTPIRRRRRRSADRPAAQNRRDW